MKKLPLPPTAQAAATPGRRTVLAAAMLAALSAPALAASPNVVISQVFGGGGNSGAPVTNDFIEIFNRGSSAVDVSNWSVQYAATGGSTWAATKIPAGTTLQAGQYLLVQEAVGTNTTTGGVQPLPTPQAIGTTAMAAGAGKVALVNNGTALTGANPSGASLVDLVGYGTGTTGYETAPTATLTNLKGVMRADGGCTDTDNNSLDFALATPAPRNTASPRNVCGGVVVQPIVATCQATLALTQGTAGSAALSATDADGIVNSAAITSTAVQGISLVNFVAAGSAGGVATVGLSVGADVGAGTYPVVVNFGNNQSEQQSCTVSVKVKGPATLTHTIPQIQGAGATSPYASSEQTTQGVVTLKVGSGFFIQDEVGDGNPLTSDGLFVFTTAANTASVNVGDKILITGTVAEYTPPDATRSYTELQAVTEIVKLGSGYSVTPTNIQLPFADLGQVEGMLVRFTNTLTVSQLEYLGDRGEVTLSSGRLEIPTNHYPAKSPEALALAAANATNVIILDDGIFVTPTTIPYLGADGSLRAGDTVSNLTGVIDFGAKGGGGAGFKLQPLSVADVQFSQDNPRTAPPQLVAGNVKVASANVLNYFTTFTDGTDIEGNTGMGCTLGASTSKSNCRGADSMAEYVRQNAKIVGELKSINADVFGLMEIQNKGEYTVSALVKSLNEAISPGTGAITYAVVPKPADTGTDAIRVAMIYKPSVLTLVGSSMTDSSAINNRPPMAQTFAAPNGVKFSLVVNHLKSKGSCPSTSVANPNPDADQGDSQSCWNATRVQQANRLMTYFAPLVASTAGDPKVLLIGDFNSYGFEDPINAITATGYVNELERHVRGKGGMPYSFVFDGTTGYLDHALASAALNASVVDAAEWHNNADEPTVLDYNLDGKPEDKYTTAPYRASDHDPVVISLNLLPPYSDVSASIRTVASGLAQNRITGKWTGTLTLTNTGSTTLTGPFQVELDGLVAGATLVNASGSHNGAPYITVSNTSLAPGASLSVPTTFTKTGTGGVTYTAVKVYSGSF